jgi:hypothetical protein
VGRLGADQLDRRVRVDRRRIAFSTTGALLGRLGAEDERPRLKIAADALGIFDGDCRPGGRGNRFVFLPERFRHEAATRRCPAIALRNSS